MTHHEYVAQQSNRFAAAASSIHGVYLSAKAKGDLATANSAWTLYQGMLGKCEYWERESARTFAMKRED